MDTNDSPVADETPDLAEEIARIGRTELVRAEENAARWAQWAVRVHQLIEDMPSVGPDPRYLADDGVEAFDVPFHVGVEDRVRMEKFLTRVLRDADAIVGAWHRAAVDVMAQSHMALRNVEADERHFVTLRGGESRG